VYNGEFTVVITSSPELYNAQIVSNQVVKICEVYGAEANGY